jgi:hypothetical protein
MEELLPLGPAKSHVLTVCRHCASSNNKLKGLVIVERGSRGSKKICSSSRSRVENHNTRNLFPAVELYRRVFSQDSNRPC